MVEKSLEEIHGKQKEIEEQADTDVSFSNEFITDIKFKKATLKYKTLQSNRWRRLASVQEIVESSVRELLEEYNIDSEDEQKIINLKTNLEQSYDEKRGLFELEKVYDEDGNLIKLKIPMYTELCEDIIIERLYDSNGEFVAEHINDQLSDVKIYELRCISLYTNYPTYSGRYSIYYDRKEYTALHKRVMKEIKQRNIFKVLKYGVSILMFNFLILFIGTEPSFVAILTFMMLITIIGGNILIKIVESILSEYEKSRMKFLFMTRET